MFDDQSTATGSVPSSVTNLPLGYNVVSPKKGHSLEKELSNKPAGTTPICPSQFQKSKQYVSSDSTMHPSTKVSDTSVFNTLTEELDFSSRCVSFWWYSTARPLARMLDQAHYQAAFQRSTLLFFHQQILPQLGPGPDKTRGSYMTDDGGPMELSCVTDGSGETIVRFSIEPLAAPDASRRFQSNRKEYVTQLLALPIISPGSDMEWFNIFSEALTLEDGKAPPLNHGATGTSEFFIGIDCKGCGLVVKAYFVPDLRSISSGQSKERMIGDVLHRVGLEKPWSILTNFFSTLATQPDFCFVAIDCAPSRTNRVKIYVRLQQVTYANLENFMTLGGTLDSFTALTMGLQTLRRAWQFLFSLDPISQANQVPRSHNPKHFASGLLLYYELKLGHSVPYPKVYFPVRHYAANDAQIALKVASLHRELGNLSIAESYVENIEKAFSHRALSSRSGIHTYVSCAVKAMTVEISSYFSPEAYAPERGLSSSDPVLQGVSFGENDISPADAAASAWVQRFATVMQDPSLPLETVFIADSFWRDLVALSSNFRTLGGIDKIRSFLSSNIPKNRPFNFHFVPDARIERITPSLHILQGRITFETRVGYCSGVFTLLRRNEGEAWNGWTMVATIEKLKGFGDTFEDPNIIRPSPSSIHQFDLSQSSNMDVIIIGGGQAGLATAARLKRVGLRTLIVERDSRIGNSWRSRYKTLKCNTPKSFSHMPFTSFPSDWPMFPQGNQVANYLERYPHMIGLNVSTSTSLLRTTFEKNSWKVCLQNGSGEWDIRARHLVLATGVDLLGNMRAKMPSWTGMSDFRGTILHSTAVKDCAAFAGKQAVVIGSGCSGHDIAQALWEGGAASVTLVQRSATAVVSESTLLTCFPDLYTGENAPPIDIADRLFLALPSGAGKIVRHAITQKIAPMDKHLLDGLKSRGFLLPCGEDTFLERLLVRRGGYYINHGCSELIIEGKLVVKSGRGVESLSSSSVHFTDGSSVNADLIICATGFELSHNPGQILGDAISSKLAKIASWDDEGEVAGVWRPSGQERLWFAGGDLFTSRFYSRLLALQIKGIEAGLINSGEKLKVRAISNSPILKILGWLFGIVIVVVAYRFRLGGAGS